MCKEKLLLWHTVTQLQDTVRAQSSTDGGEAVTSAGEQLAVTPAAVDTQQAGKTTATGKKRTQETNTPEPDSTDDRKSR